MTKDIQVGQNSEQALIDSELWMKSIFDSLDEAVLVVSPDRKILNVNSAANRIFGYSTEEILSSSTELFHVDHQHYVEFGEIINHAFAKNKAANFEFESKRKNGEIFPSEHTVSLLKAPDGEVKGIVSVIRDISTRQETEQILKSQAATIEMNRVRFESMFESIPDAIVYADPDRKIQMVNSATMQMFGYAESELLDNEIKILYSSEDDFHQQSENRYGPDKKVTHKSSENKYRRKNGQEFTCETLSTSVKSSDGEIQGYLDVIRDVSKREFVDDMLRSLAEGASGLQFKPFLDEVLERLTNLYNCKYAFIGQLQKDGLHVQTLAVRVDGQSVDNFEYTLKGTPCQDVLDLTKSLISKDASKLYSEDQMLVDMGVESYFGSPLISSEGSNLGLLALMDVAPLQIDDWTEPVLGVFSKRVSLELERDLALQELQHHKAHLQDLVVERTADLSAARDFAEKANAAKSGFLSRMSHELRTPMNAILGFGQLLEMDSEGFTKIQRDNIKEITDAGHHLLMLINEVLDLAKIESGNLKLSMKDVAVDEVMQQSISLIRPLAESRHIELSDHVSAKGHIVHADATRLKQVFVNLLSNAVKYNSENGRITIDSELTDKQRLRIRVTDSGEGLTEDDIDKLFTPFERLNRTHNIEGAGIGLVITKHLVELMNGSIGVESVPGQSSTFWMELELTN